MNFLVSVSVVPGTWIATRYSPACVSNTRPSNHSVAGVEVGRNGTFGCGRSTPLGGVTTASGLALGGSGSSVGPNSRAEIGI